MRILVVVVSLVWAAAAVGYVLLDTDNDEIEALQVEIAQLRTDLAKLQIKEPPSTSTTVAPATTPPPPTSTFAPTNTIAVVTTTTKAPPTSEETESLLPHLSDMPLGWSPVNVTNKSESYEYWCGDSALWDSVQASEGHAYRSCFANGPHEPVYRVRLEVAGFLEISQATDLVHESRTMPFRDVFLHSKGLGVSIRAYSSLLSPEFILGYTPFAIQETSDYAKYKRNTNYYCYDEYDWCDTADDRRGLLEVYESALGPEGSVTRVSDVQVYDHSQFGYLSSLEPLTREISVTHTVGYCMLSMHMWARNEVETALYFDEDSFGLAAAIAEMFMTDFNESLEECTP